MGKVPPKKPCKNELNDLKKSRVGTVYYDKRNKLMKIIEYNNNKDVTVEYIETGGIKHTQYSNIIKGNVVDPFECIALGVGYFGNRINIDKIDKKIYSKWYGMLRRVYKPSSKEILYKDCIICEEWKCFFNFQDWYKNELKKYSNKDIDELDLEIDKDILYKNNRIYSPKYCCLVPKKLNLVFSHSCPPTELPVGVKQEKNRYIARCTNQNGRNFLGSFLTIEEAFEAYKECKEKYIKYLATLYKDIIPANIYKALIEYEVNIDDWRVIKNEK